MSPGSSRPIRKPSWTVPTAPSPLSSLLVPQPARAPRRTRHAPAADSRPGGRIRPVRRFRLPRRLVTDSPLLRCHSAQPYPDIWYTTHGHTSHRVPEEPFLAVITRTPPAPRPVPDPREFAPSEGASRVPERSTRREL